MSSHDLYSKKREGVEYADVGGEVEDLILETIMQELMYDYSSPVSTNEDSQGVSVHPTETNQWLSTGYHQRSVNFM